MLSHTKLSRLFVFTLGYGLPIIISGILFLVLYNNSKQGFLILSLLLAFNLSIFLGSKKFLPTAKVAEYLRSGAVCVVTIVLSVVLLEMVFPVFLPKDYAQIMELTRTDSEKRRLRDFHPDRIFGVKGVSKN